MGTMNGMSADRTLKTRTVKIKTKTMRAMAAETEMEMEQGIIAIMKNIDILNTRVDTPPENPLESTTDIIVLVETGITAQVEAGVKAATPKVIMSVIILVTKTRMMKIRHQSQKSLSQYQPRKVQRSTPLTLDSSIQELLVH
jgi:hypothetical protein